MKVIKKVKQGNQNSIKNIINNIEALTFKNVKENYPNYWENDVINLCFFKEVSSLLNRKTIKVPGNTIKSNWKLLKLKEVSEKNFGDIAIILNITYHDGHNNEGVVFLSTAVKDPDKNTYSTIKKDELRRISNNSPHSQLILYDYDSITGMAFPAAPESIIGDYPQSWDSWMPYTHAATATINQVVSLGLKNTGLYKIAIPLSYQICYKYLYGLDLDYSTVAVETARGERTDKGSAKYLVAISIAHGGTDIHENVKYDKDMYSILE